MLAADLNALLALHPVTGETLDHLPPSCEPNDLLGLPQEVEPATVIVTKSLILAASLRAQCESEHIWYGNPFCPGCRPQYAIRSLQRRLALDIRFDPTKIDCGPPVAVASRSAFYTYDDLLGLPEPHWLIDGVVPQGGIGYITGRDGSYKTFLAIDIAISTVCWYSSPRDWHGGRYVEAGGYGRALILEGEGVSSIRKRIDATIEAKGIELSASQKASIVIRNGTVNLYGGNGDFHALLDYVTAFAPDVIIVDTLNRSSGAADQNSASDMSIITTRLHMLEVAAEVNSTAGERCTVIVVAHTDKGDNDARGSSAIEDDADFVLHCKKKEDRLAITVAKMKDGESGFVIDLQAVEKAGSLALMEPTTAADPLWSASSPRSRVIGALRTLQPQQWCTQAEVFAVAKDDQFDGEVNRGTVSREVNRLISECAVEKHASAKAFRLVAGWSEPIPASTLEGWLADE